MEAEKRDENLYGVRERDFLQMQLYYLGVNRNYEGFGLALEMALLVGQDEDCRTCMKRVYMDVAKKNRTNKENVRRDITTLIRVIWHNGNKSLLEEMAGREFVKPPTCQEFVWILADHMKKRELSGE